MKIYKGIIYSGLILLNVCLKGYCQTDQNVLCNGITVYIDYPDVPASVSKVQLDSIINGINYQEKGIQRTFRKYWYQQTRRNIVTHQDIFFYTAPMPSTYYDTVGWQKGILLWKEALEYVVANHPTYDWKSLHLHENGGLKSVMIISSKWGPDGIGAGHKPNWTLSNGTKVSYIYGSVLKAPWDVSNNLFMTIHESGHGIFGFPDTYDTEYNSGGTWYYTLMSGGKNDVEPLGAPFMVQKQWGHILNLKPGTHTITLKADGDSVVVFRNVHDTLEFFSIEARKKTTEGNTLFPVDLGLLIWHSDLKVNTSNTLQDRTPQRHYMHSVVQADGLYELEKSLAGGNAGDIYIPGKLLNNDTDPSTKWWDNSASEVSLSNIEFVGADKIRFTITVPPPHPSHYDYIPQNLWKVISSPKSQKGYEVSKAFDGNVNTYYHIPTSNNIKRPHEIVLDLTKNYSLNELYYTANMNTTAPYEGRIEQYEVYISSDTLHWGAPVASGTFFRTSLQQYVLFPETVGRYLKFSAITSYNSDLRTSIAEIRLRGVESVLTSTFSAIDHDDFRVYPNPNSGEFTIEHIADTADISVYDMLGQEVLFNKAIDKNIKIRIEQKGIYILNIKTKHGDKRQKIIVN
jgi:M6 family metalloprotease-like protein